MKELGIYDDATIIIMSDHGRFDDGLAYPTFMLKTPNAQGSIEISTVCASQKNLHATILACAGLEVPETQTAIFSLTEETDEQRRFLYYPTTHANGGYLPDMEEYVISKGLNAVPTGDVYTRNGVVSSEP